MPIVSIVQIQMIRLRLRKLSIDEIKNKLEKLKYKLVGSGSFKTVYKKKSEPFCIKVYDFPGAYEEDSYYIPFQLRPYYLYPIHKTKKYMVQPWANHVGETAYIYCKQIPHKIKQLGYDVREDDNIGLYNNKEVIIDCCTHN